MKKKLLKLLATTLLLTSCASRSVGPVSPKPCVVSPFPVEAGPEIKVDDTGHLTDDTVIALGLWVRDAIANHDDVKNCPYVKERTKQ